MANPESPALPKINKIIKILIFSDVLILGSFGFLNPIFAIFINDNIIGGSLEVAGIAAAIYLLVKASLQIPIGRYVDKDRKDKNDFWFLVVGSLLIAIVPILYSFSTFPWHIYLLQVVYGIGAAMSFTTWFALFTRHIDKFHEAYEWAVYDTATGITAGICAAIGGLLAERLGFNFIFYLTSIITLSGSFLLLAIYNRVLLWDSGRKEQN
ncbi:MAG: MFS transporter [Patescibacteria group bacterium]|nr:MFS transporter [Patescibacteria group bacterium]MDD5490581.1 MFS transporter [Patescibacteria group bacterium]